MARVHQTLVCVLESYGALNVLLLGIIRFPRTSSDWFTGWECIFTEVIALTVKDATGPLGLPCPRPAPPYELAPAIA